MLKGLVPKLATVLILWNEQKILLNGLFEWLSKDSIDEKIHVREWKAKNKRTSDSLSLLERLHFVGENKRSGTD